MSINSLSLVLIAALLLTACVDQETEPAAASAQAVGACGVEASIPDGATLRAEDVPVAGGEASSRYVVLPEARCSGVARRPDQCDRFPWATERNLYALGGRGWLTVALGESVREQVVLYEPESSFAKSFEQAAEDCGFEALTVVDGAPATLERGREGVTEIVYLTPRSMVWMSSADPAVGLADLVRLAGVAEERSTALTYPS
ncbi:hypothetical protein [Actinoplanes regularis]|uniref:hypothetical protein n=1 Tax=Actinoplanes regularis TaxID=52697 RepID=UPI00255364FD|nr:hypothetical protein [Actinoplanes regularis]GLW27833.1 hypothetical protein Areg01_07730 [Actinoplanes regularis]